MKLKFDVSLDEYKIINAILNEHLVPRCLVFVFGSRAKNTARFNSDLDLAIASDKPLTQKETVMLKDAFNESRLPYKVDVVDMHNIEKSFRDIIDSQKVGFPLSRSLSGVEGKGNVPELRFPGFSGPWVGVRLGAVANFLKGKGISKTDIVQNGALECVRYGELYTHYDEVITDIRSKTNLGMHELVLSNANDVIIPASGESQLDIAKASCITKSGVALGGDLNIIRSKNSGVFLSYYLNGIKKIEIARLSQGISVIHLYSSQLKTLTLNLPSLPEQQKIADFLTSVDNKIQSLTQKKEALSRYKKGLLQTLFPKAGETVPELRFDGFSEPWVGVRLGAVANFLKGKGISKTDIVQNGALECVRYGELYTHYDEVITDIRSKTNLGMHELVLSNANDVIIPASGESQLDIAKASCITKSGVALGGDLNIIRSKNSGVFLSYYLNGIKKIEIARLSQGISVIHLYSSQLKTLTLNFPSLPEQQKIADFLTTVDNKITQVDQQIENMNQFKKGLLQQMFV